jgi:hypothetical protein
MRRIVLVFSSVLAFNVAATAAAGPTGAYRLTATAGGTSFTVLVSFSQQGNGWTGQYLGSLDLPAELAPAVIDVRVVGDRLRFTLALSRSQVTTFDGKLPTGRGPIPGSLAAGETLILVTLEPSALTKFDRAGVLKEIVTTAPPGPLFYGAVVELLAAAGEMKATPDEVKAWAERAAKAAEANGIRWQMYVLLRMSRALADQPAHAVAALDLVRRAERLLDPADEVGVQLAVLDLTKRLLIQTNNATAVEPIQARIDALEARDYRDYLAASPVRPELFAGRKVRSDRVVLLELFTGTEDPPSLAAVLAFDAVARAYKPTEVVRLQYHLNQQYALNQPFADPLANKAAEIRWAYYQPQLGAAAGVPTAVFNGRPGAVGGGGADVAAIKLKQYRTLIDPLLDTPAGATLQLSAKRIGDKVTITAKVTGLAKPGDKVRLRLTLAETTVRYAGSNGVRYHQSVVRGFAGSPDGLPLPKSTAEHEVTVDVAALRTGLGAELDEFQKKNDGLLFADRPLDLRTFLVVGFIQDDVTHDVLQAAQVEVK